MLALAGVERLGIDNIPVRPIPVERCLPAVGQGMLGLETRMDDRRTSAMVLELEHGPTRRVAQAERSFLHHLGGGCLAPATGFGTLEGDAILIRGMVGDPDGRSVLRDQESGGPAAAEEIGRLLAERMRKAGAGLMLEKARESAGGAEPPSPS